MPFRACAFARTDWSSGTIGRTDDACRDMPSSAVRAAKQASLKQINLSRATPSLAHLDRRVTGVGVILSCRMMHHIRATRTIRVPSTAHAPGGTFLSTPRAVGNKEHWYARIYPISTRSPAS